MATHPKHPNLIVFDHPLIQHKLTHLRDRETGFRACRALMFQIAGLMVYEVTRTFPSERVTIQTPIEPFEGRRINAKITVVPVLRAGLGMAEGVLDAMPEARVGHIGLFRDEETLNPIQYLSRLPKDLDAGPVILVDPMLATGGSASKAIAMLKAAGATDIRMLCLVASPEGVQRLAHDHPELTIYAAALDRALNEHGYIMPGLGDAGDRLYGTG
ncbi:MAG: uracil phosphoribosyltransferase [Phycisphaerae bacterium]|nr:uracil phosphoribosyltransferase [Phycisphaerae bacterium]